MNSDRYGFDRSGLVPSSETADGQLNEASAETHWKDLDHLDRALEMVSAEYSSAAEFRETMACVLIALMEVALAPAERPEVAGESTALDAGLVEAYGPEPEDLFEAALFRELIKLDRSWN